MKPQPVSTPHDANAIVSFPCGPDSASTGKISSNPTEFHEIPRNSTLISSQASGNQHVTRKQPLGIFAQKISPDQRSQLFEWLADHTYDEVIELVAADPPAGFGIKVGKST